MVLNLVFPKRLLDPKVRAKVIDQLKESKANDIADNYNTRDIYEREIWNFDNGVAPISDWWDTDEELLDEYLEQFMYRYEDDYIETEDEERSTYLESMGLRMEHVLRIEDYPKFAEYLTVEIVKEALTDASP